MNPLLILREEIVCLVILLFLLVNALAYQTGRDSGSFLRLALCAVGHVACEILVVLAMNPPGRVGAGANRLFHAFFYLFAVLFAYEFFCCTVRLGFASRAAVRRARRWGLPAVLLYAAALPFLPLYYLKGNGIHYGMGPFIVVSFAVAMLYFAASAVILFLRRRRIPRQVKLALLPLLLAMMATEGLQWAVPELFFSGGALTVVTVGFFFALENPADFFRQKIQVDALTGVKSRHCYETDIRQVEQRYREGGRQSYAVVFCDINNLKAVNNLYGHLEGDRYISAIAGILTREMKSAERIYRMGGDEFMALYHNQPESVIQGEIQAVHGACQRLSQEKEYPAGVAVGYALSGSGYRSIREVLKVADYRMYKDKAEQKAQLTLHNEGSQCNVTGLTDRLFDAVAQAAGDRCCPFLYNMETNMARISPFWVEQFGLPGEFLYDFPAIWLDWLHPDDRERYQQDLRQVLAGKFSGRTQEYRARNRAGEYVVCTCRSHVLRGKNGEPDLLAGVLVNHGITDRLDPVTGLACDEARGVRVGALRQRGEKAVLMKLGVQDFSRVNMLYGYAGGSDALRQLADRLRALLPPGGELFRSEGPRFTLCLPGEDRGAAEKLYQAIRAAAEGEIRLGVSLVPLRLAGAAYLLSAGEEETVSIRSGLLCALEESRHQRQGALVFFGEEGQDYRLLAQIHRDAVGDRQGFLLRYQPIVRVGDGKTVGAEALLCWQDLLWGQVGPSRFLPWLENDPCFFELGFWILRRAVSDARAMLALCPDFVLNVNITVGQLQHRDFLPKTLEILRQEGFPPGHLCLELTERCKELDIDVLCRAIEAFRREGVRLALDDLGTGSASFGLLLRLPIQEIKLDKSFVGEIPWKRPNRIFADAAVQAAKGMDYAVCFEGVENEETYRYLQSYGDVLCQGYYFARPLPAEDLLRRLREEKTSDGSEEI